MAAITGVVLLLLLAGLFYLFRAMGRMGQQPSPQERMKHSGDERGGHGPRATGLN
jgi:hypothetical protein